MGLNVVGEMQHGVYLWQLPDGRFLDDGDGHFLSINSMKGDISRMATIAKTAASLGYPVGQPAFQAGHRQVSDSEYDRQMERLLDGETPDEYDIGALLDEERARRA
jgi:hypothetical protein